MAPHDNRKAPTQRQLRVGEQVRRAVVDVLQHGHLHDPSLDASVISVSEVQMSADLKIATIYVTALGGKGNEGVIRALERNAKFIRGRMSAALRHMRYMPQVQFRADTSFDNFDKIDRLLRSPEVARDLGRGENGGE